MTNVKPEVISKTTGCNLSKRLQKKAREELNENPENTREAIDDVKELLETLPDTVIQANHNCAFLRRDDSFITRFLRARKFCVVNSFKLLTQYSEHHQHNEKLFEDFNNTAEDISQALSDGLPGVLPSRDQAGRHILILYAANWDQETYNLTAIHRAILLTLEKLIEDEAAQINGFVVVVDWSQFSWWQSTWLNPLVLKSMIYSLQDCFPARLGAVHFVNQPWYVRVTLKLVKPLLKEKAKQKLFLHGNNVSTLHQHIAKEVLPSELGGAAPPYNTEYWAKHICAGSHGFGTQVQLEPGLEQAV